MRATAGLHFPIVLAWIVCIGLVTFGAQTSLAVSAAFSPHVLWPVDEAASGYLADDANLP